MEEKRLAILKQKEGEKRIVEREEKKGKKKRKERKERKKKKFVFFFSYFGLLILVLRLENIQIFILFFVIDDSCIANVLTYFII